MTLLKTQLPLPSAWSCLHTTAFPHYLKPGLTVSEQQQLNPPAHDGHVGYHLREGRHNLGLADWNWFMDFADKHLQKP